MTRPVVAFQIRGRDATKLAEFYKEIFGWKMSSANPMGIVSIEAGEGGPLPGPGGFILPGDPMTILFVQVASLQDSMAKAVELGGKRVMEPFDVPNGPTVAQIEDPEGNVVGLVQQ
jgi:predicted enzyme related to lactoylglutathione lyase